MDSVLVIELPGPDVRLVPVRNEFGMLAKGTAHLIGVVPDYFVRIEPTRRKDNWRPPLPHSYYE